MLIAPRELCACRGCQRVGKVHGDDHVIPYVADEHVTINVQAEFSVMCDAFQEPLAVVGEGAEGGNDEGDERRSVVVRPLLVLPLFGDGTTIEKVVDRGRARGGAGKICGCSGVDY